MQNVFQPGRAIWTLAPLCLLLCSFAAGQARIADRVVIRIEDDVILLSDVQTADRFQRLVNGAPNAPTTKEEWTQLLRQLVDQWIIEREALAVRFQPPKPPDVDREFAKLTDQIGTPEVFQQKLSELGLTEATVRRLLTRQLHLLRYLDYKFRPAILIERQEIDDYYRDRLVPRLNRRGQPVPPIEKVEDQIREVILTRKLTEKADQWMQETSARAKIEVLVPDPSEIARVQKGGGA